MIQKKFKQLIMLTLLIGGSSCSVQQEIATDSVGKVQTTIEKKSIFEALKENEHLPIQDQIAVYHELKKDHLDEYNFEDEQELNRYGYFLMNEEKLNDAIEIFKLLVSEFPESSNANDSLGEAYMKDGNDALAIFNYEKSVELNPKNYHGVDQLTILKGQEILVTDWGKEFFHFPLHFAPDIPYEGVEEVVFPRDWIKPDSADFWSYVFVWELDNKKNISKNELERVFKLYFDGLMEVVNDDKDIEMIETSASFFKNEYPSDNADFMGNLTIFDAFATKKPLDLNAKVFSKYCEKRKKLILLFHFSPKDYSHWIWSKLSGAVLLRKPLCLE